MVKMKLDMEQERRHRPRAGVWTRREGSGAESGPQGRARARLPEGRELCRAKLAFLAKLSNRL